MLGNMMRVKIQNIFDISVHLYNEIPLDSQQIVLIGEIFPYDKTIYNRNRLRIIVYVIYD